VLQISKNVSPMLVLIPQKYIKENCTKPEFLLIRMLKIAEENGINTKILMRPQRSKLEELIDIQKISKIKR